MSDATKPSNENTADSNQDTFAFEFDAVMNQFVENLEKLGIKTFVLTVMKEQNHLMTHNGPILDVTRLACHTARLLKTQILKDLEV